MEKQPNRETRRRQWGYTLVELMVTLGVAGVFIAAAAPMVSNILSSNRMTSIANQMIGMMGYARSEAVKRGSQVTVCRSNGGTSCNGTQWENGWIVFADTDRDGVVDSGETILRVREALPANFTLRGGASATSSIAFLPSGKLSSGINSVFALCLNSSTSNMQGILVNKLGRIRAAQDSNGDGLQENDSGTNLSCNPS